MPIEFNWTPVQNLFAPDLMEQIEGFLVEQGGTIRRPVAYYPVPRQNGMPAVDGIDVPVWVRGDGNERRPIIAIVAQDPKRVVEDFARCCAIQGQAALVGTPWGAHDAVHRVAVEWMWWKTFDPILAAGHDLYLTDVRKVYTIPRSERASEEEMGHRGIVWVVLPG